MHSTQQPCAWFEHIPLESSDGQNSIDSLKPIRESIVFSWIDFPFWIGFLKKSVYFKNGFF